MILPTTNFTTEHTDTWYYKSTKRMVRYFARHLLLELLRDSLRFEPILDIFVCSCPAHTIWPIWYGHTLILPFNGLSGFTVFAHGTCCALHSTSHTPEILCVLHPNHMFTQSLNLEPDNFPLFQTPCSRNTTLFWWCKPKYKYLGSRPIKFPLPPVQF